MGKTEKKKKGIGAQKTEAKTQKKSDSKLKKTLAKKGEEDIETILSKFVEETTKLNAVNEDLVPTPSKRSAFTISVHPEKEYLVLFGGEYFNGIKTLVFNDLFFYKIKQGTWLKITGPVEPTPRCSHQSVVLPQNGGEMWIFGGEFVSPSQSQFYHYKDLWLFSFKSRRWEKIVTKGSGPCARSGHRMIGVKKKLFVFGGFKETSSEFKYFNDLYMFDTETYQWHKIEPSGNPPCPRSGCQIIPLPDSKILVYGGYSKEHVKKDVDKGVTHSDMFILVPDKHDTTGLKFKWSLVKPGGVKPAPRCAFSMCLHGTDKAILFGGVDDTEEDSELQGSFFNDLFSLDLKNLVWHELLLKPKKSLEIDSCTLSESSVKCPEKEIENLKIDEEKVVSDDGVFTVSIGPDKINSAQSSTLNSYEERAPNPPQRINPGIVVRKGILYLYGGIFEDGDKQLTLNDFYSLDLNKLTEWTTIIALNAKDQEWFDSESEDSDDDESESQSDESNDDMEED